jgi:hypothetical protein
MFDRAATSIPAPILSEDLASFAPPFRNGLAFPPLRF